jgi:hypothetical protein
MLRVPTDRVLSLCLGPHGRPLYEQQVRRLRNVGHAKPDFRFSLFVASLSDLSVWCNSCDRYMMYILSLYFLDRSPSIGVVVQLRQKPPFRTLAQPLTRIISLEIRREPS